MGKTEIIYNLKSTSNLIRKNIGYYFDFAKLKNQHIDL